MDPYKISRVENRRTGAGTGSDINSATCFSFLGINSSRKVSAPVIVAKLTARATCWCKSLHCAIFDDSEIQSFQPWRAWSRCGEKTKQITKTKKLLIAKTELQNSLSKSGSSFKTVMMSVRGFWYCTRILITLTPLIRYVNFASLPFLLCPTLIVKKEWSNFNDD